MGRGAPSRVQAQRRQAQAVGLAGFVAAAALPALLFRHAIGAVTFRLQAGYLTGWAPWALMALGLLFWLPVLVSAGRDPSSSLYPRARRAYAGWAITLYLLGFGLATQVSSLVQVTTPR